MSDCAGIPSRRKNGKDFFTIFKILFFIICFSGFTYQATEYFIIYFSYPTVLDMKIESKRAIILPALSFCEVASTSRSKYCSKNPHYCKNITKDDDICIMYPEYCGEDEPFVQTPFIIENSTIYRMKNYGKPWWEYLEVENRSFEQDIGEPFYTYATYPILEYYRCYTMNSRLDSGKDPVEVTQDYWKYLERTELFWLKFRLDFNEAFQPGTVPAIHLQVHSPFVTANPVQQGIRMKPEMLYYIDIRLVEEHRLPSPYSTGCTNYTSVWERNNRTGSRSQKGCKELCSAKHTLDLYGCIHIFHKFPSPLKCSEYLLAPIVEKQEEKRIQDVYQQCLSKCNTECLELKYEYTVRDLNLRRKPNATKKELHVQVFLDEPDIFVLEYKPQYKKVEFFSYLGGFLGCWLGISLFALSDFAKNAYNFMKMRYHQTKDSKR